MWASNLSCLDSMNFMFQRIGEGAWQMMRESEALACLWFYRREERWWNRKSWISWSAFFLSLPISNSSFQEGEIERGFVDHSRSLIFKYLLQLIRRRRSVNGIGSKARMIVKCPMFQLLNRCSRCRGPSGSFNRFRIKGTWPKKRFLRKKQGAEVRDEDHWLWWLGLVAANPTLIGTNLFNRYGKEALKRIFL